MALSKTIAKRALVRKGGIRTVRKMKKVKFIRPAKKNKIGIFGN